MNINEFHPTSGRFVKEDGATVNIADALGGKSVSDKVYDINNMMPHSGRFIKEDGTCVNIADMIANGDIGGGGGSDSGSSDDSAPPIVETYNGQVIQSFISADRPLKGLNLYATCKQETYEGKNLFNLDDLLSLIPESGTDMDNVELKVTGLMPNATYTLSSTIEGDIGGDYTNRCLYIGGEEIDNCVFAGHPVSISSGDNGEILVYFYPFRDVAQDIKSGNGNVQLEKGAVPTTYEPYTGGIPSPNVDYPQEIQTISDFVVEVKNSMEADATPQTLDVTIPEQGFYGLVVDSDGNYTDSNNQRWYADCFNYKTKKFVKCIEKTTAIGEKADETALVSGFGFASRIATVDTSTKYGMCEKLLWSSTWNTQNEAFTFAKTSSGVDSYDIIATLSHGTLGTTNETTIQNATSAFKTYLSSNPLTFFYVSKTPIEYDLTDAQVEEFENLRSYYGTTYIDNDAVPACNMTAEIIADTKLYIDSKLSS